MGKSILTVNDIKSFIFADIQFQPRPPLRELKCLRIRSFLKWEIIASVDTEMAWAMIEIAGHIFQEDVSEKDTLEVLYRLWLLCPELFEA